MVLDAFRRVTTKFSGFLAKISGADASHVRSQRRKERPPPFLRKLHFYNDLTRSERQNAASRRVPAAAQERPRGGGRVATLECVPPRGHPEPTVTWFKDGVQVQPGTGRVRLLAQGTLLIADVRLSDEGRYVCRATNMLGTRDSPPALLSVHTKPYFVRVPEDVTTLTEESVEFECKVNGDPKPTVTWRRKDGKMPIG
ncbi:hypothetical protein MRX96_044424, partial [Rhipicephalus microplus]